MEVCTFLDLAFIVTIAILIAVALAFSVLVPASTLTFIFASFDDGRPSCLISTAYVSNNLKTHKDKFLRAERPRRRADSGTTPRVLRPFLVTFFSEGVMGGGCPKSAVTMSVLRSMFRRF